MMMIFICIFVIGIFGGFLLGVRSVSGLALYEWETTTLIRRIEITPKTVSCDDNDEDDNKVKSVVLHSNNDIINNQLMLLTRIT